MNRREHPPWPAIAHTMHTPHLARRSSPPAPLARLATDPAHVASRGPTKMSRHLSMRQRYAQPSSARATALRPGSLPLPCLLLAPCTTRARAPHRYRMMHGSHWGFTYCTVSPPQCERDTKAAFAAHRRPWPPFCRRLSPRWFQTEFCTMLRSHGSSQRSPAPDRTASARRP